VHFDAHAQASSRFGKRLVYGGHIISMARALSFNGIENAAHLVALNAGTHANPAFAGDTIYAWSEIVEKAEVPGRHDAGFIRLRTVALKNREASGFPARTPEGAYAPEVILDIDCWAVMPR
jgi:2-methylfumaryl-CoA hydratase